MLLRGRKGGSLPAVSAARSHVFRWGVTYAGMMRVLFLGLERVVWLVVLWRRKRRRGGRRLWLMAVEVLRRRRRRLTAARAVLFVGVCNLLLLLLLLFVAKAQLFLALGAEAADASTRVFSAPMPCTLLSALTPNSGSIQPTPTP